MVVSCPAGKTYDEVAGDCVSCDDLCDDFFGREENCLLKCPGYNNANDVGERSDNVLNDVSQENHTSGQAPMSRDHLIITVFSCFVVLMIMVATVYYIYKRRRRTRGKSSSALSDTPSPIGISSREESLDNIEVVKEVSAVQDSVPHQPNRDSDTSMLEASLLSASSPLLISFPSSEEHAERETLSRSTSIDLGLQTQVKGSMAIAGPAAAGSSGYITEDARRDHRHLYSDSAESSQEAPLLPRSFMETTC